MNAIFRQAILIGSTAVLVVACSGGGGGDGSSTNAPPSNQPPPGGDATATTLVSGAITGFGSVIVNGTRYETTSADVLIEGRPATVAELKVGHVIRLQAESGADGNHQARRIEMHRLMQGSVEAVDPVAGTVTISGQVVRVDDDTSFDDSIPQATLAGINVGDRIEAHGYIGSDDRARATRIERADDGETEVEVEGPVAELDSAAGRFRVGELWVNYSSAMIDGFGEGTLSEGDLVEVKGDAFAADGALIATRVSREDGHLNGHDGDEAEVEGLITRFASSADFDVSGQPVRTTASTSYIGGVAADLRADIKVEVEGEFDAGGVLVARYVHLRHRASVKLSARVDAIDPEAGSFQTLGLTVFHDASTRREDKSDDDHFFAPEDLRVGDWVEVRGYPDPSVPGALIATGLERDDPEDQVELRGTASDLNPPLFVIAGVNIETTSGTQFEQDDQDIAAATFFSEANNRIVDVEGQWSGVAIVADDVEIEHMREGGGTPPPPIEPPPVGNRAPVAQAGPAQSVTVGSPVTLDGSASSDPDGDPLSYAWVLETPASSAATLAAADTSAPSFNADVAGGYTARLTVNDGELQDTASVTVTARDPAVNTAPTAMATASKTQAAVGETITLSAAGSSDPEGQTLSYAWSLTRPAGSTAALSGDTLASPAFTADVAGDYTATLRVNDGELGSAPASVTVTANAVVALDGAKLYGDNCSSCHSAIDSIQRMAPDKRSATDIRSAINSNKGGMSFLSPLTDDEVQAIADAIAAANP